MTCEKCGAKNNDGSKFCNSCGQKLSQVEEKTKKYDGEVKKCPNCGEIVNSFSLKCDICGYEFRNVKSSIAITDLSKSLETISKEVKNSFGDGLSSMLQNGKIDRKTSIMIEKISSFAIPNSKEDIIEFMIMASSNININILSKSDLLCYGMNRNDLANKKALSEAWISKMKQAYGKAQVVSLDDANFNKIENIYKGTISEIQRARLFSIIKPILPFAVILAICIIPLITINPERKLNRIYNEIQLDINNGKYNEALIKANELRVDRDYSRSLANLWDEKREAVIKIIKEKQGAK